jgi:signal transduction histidine kinase
METLFAPAGRDDACTLERRLSQVRQAPLLQTMLDAIAIPAIVLNECRQILAANRSLLKLLGVDSSVLIGKRPGEVMGCAYWPEGPDGCGTTRHCLTCGAVSAIMESRAQQVQVTRECRMTLDHTLDGGALDLRVTASAVTVEGELVTVCILEDISREKRLNVLSRVFFHDVLNTAGGIQGYAHLLEETAPQGSETGVELQQLGRLADQLVAEIESQRDLTLAESGDLVLNLEAVSTTELLSELRALYLGHDVGQRRRIVLDNPWDGRIVTDVRLLSRVLGNMLKNALEATKTGGTVTLRCTHDAGYAEFSVHNPSCMPEEVQLQVFQRSFSTKGAAGRGIGTYSMKLLGEQYLGGQVAFRSSPSDGTTFVLRLPRVLLMPARTTSRTASLQS